MDVSESNLSNVFNNDTASTARVILAYSLVYASYGLVVTTINLLTLAVILRTPALRQQQYTWPLASLCVVDCLQGLLLLFSTTTFSLHLGGCKRSVFMDILGACLFISQWHSVAMTTDRFVAVEHPLRYHDLMTPLKVRLLVGGAWALGLSAKAGHILVEFTAPNCDSVGRAVTIYELSHLTLIFLVNAGLYTQIGRAAHRQRVAMHDGNNKKTGVVNRTTVMILLIVGLSYVMWLPYYATMFAMIFAPRGSLPPTIGSRSDIFAGIGILSCIVNNVVYAGFNKEVRKAFVRMCGCSRRNNQVQDDSTVHK